MKEMKKIFLMMASLAALSACSVKGSAEGGSGPASDPQKQSSGSWPELAKTTLGGNVMGHAWNAQTAILRPSQGDAKNVVVEIYGEKLANACANGANSSQLPFVTVTLPADYKLQQYITDMNQRPANAMPLVFSTFVPQADNVIADRTKLSIDAISDHGFTGALYAHGTSASGDVSEINGQIEVLDCSKVASFDVWRKMVGSYSLNTLDGVQKTDVYTSIQERKDVIYDRASKQYLSMIEFPLYYSASDSGGAEYNLGPIEGLGTTTIKGSGAQTTYVYRYDGPTNFNGGDVEIHVEISATPNGNTLDVTYTIEIPNYVKKDTHSFQLKY
jgi:hypothetical protein